MRTFITALLVAVAAQLTANGQSTNEMFKMRGTVVAESTITGLTFANPHRYVRVDPPVGRMTVRVESITPALTNYAKGVLVSFSSAVQSNFFPRHVIQGATYDFVIARKVDASTSVAEQTEFKAPPKLVSQPQGPSKGSSPARPSTPSPPGPNP